MLEKTWYLNVPFFIGRAIVYFVVWLGLAFFLYRWSVAEDESDVNPRRFRRLSGPGLVLYGGTITFASVDWVMSLEPHWYSTIYPVIFAVGQILEGMAFSIIVLVCIGLQPPFENLLGPTQRRDLGNLLLAFVMMWAYLSFSQFLLIWSENVPEEIPWYLKRTREGWQWLALVLVIFQFCLPFLLLLSREIKQDPRRLAAVALLVLIMRYLDVFWWIEPAFADGVYFYVLVDLAALVGLFWWRRDSVTTIGSAFRAVRWEWVVVAIALNLLSVVARAIAWTTVIHSAMEPPRPRGPLVFSAFSVGLFANAVLPGRIGELARVAVLTRKMPGRKGAWATLVGTVFAHRVFDIVPVILLILYVVVTASIPGSARATLVFVIGFGVGLFVFAFLSARRHHHEMAIEGLGPVRRLLTMGRAGLRVMRAPAEAAVAIAFQIIGWTCQILAVYTAMRAFDIHSPLPAAGVVLLLMNVVTIFPFWPGNVGLVQVAIASALVGYGVSYSVGVAYGFGLQAIEASVGIGVGLLFLAREGLSFAMLRVMPTADKAEHEAEESAEEPDRPAERSAAG